MLVGRIWVTGWVIWMDRWMKRNTDIYVDMGTRRKIGRCSTYPSGTMEPLAIESAGSLREIMQSMHIYTSHTSHVIYIY